jgi:multidrug efflux pump subunit AcrB
VLLHVARSADAGERETAKAVRAALEKWKQSAPKGIELRVVERGD